MDEDGRPGARHAAVEGLTVPLNPHQRHQITSTALDQLGKQYVFGTAGPTTYDCSGLVCAAYGAAGVYLPHNALAQHDATARIWENGLVPRPGDLIFYYAPIEHVAIFLGHDFRGQGRMVSATDDAHGVEWITVEQYAHPVSWGTAR